jgi:hypothetical protein
VAGGFSIARGLGITWSFGVAEDRHRPGWLLQATETSYIRVLKAARDGVFASGFRRFPMVTLTSNPVMIIPCHSHWT